MSSAGKLWRKGHSRPTFGHSLPHLKKAHQFNTKLLTFYAGRECHITETTNSIDDFNGNQKKKKKEKL